MPSLSRVSAIGKGDHEVVEGFPIKTPTVFFACGEKSTSLIVLRTMKEALQKTIFCGGNYERKV